MVPSTRAESNFAALAPAFAGSGPDDGRATIVDYVRASPEFQRKVVSHRDTDVFEDTSSVGRKSVSRRAAEQQSDRVQASSRTDRRLARSRTD